MRRLFANKLVIGVLVVLALAAQYGLAWLSHPVAASSGRLLAPPGRASVTAAIRACPLPGSISGSQVALIAATAAAGQAGQAGAGTAVVSRLSAAGSAAAGRSLITRTQPGVLTREKIPLASARSGRLPGGGNPAAGGKIPVSPARGGVIVRATGSMAGALEVEQTGGGGLPTAACGGPGTDFWFVGPGQHAVAGLQLYLMNADSQPADAEVDIFTDSGPLLGTIDTGIAVPAHGLLVQSLAKLVHGSRVVALHVRTSVGRLVAALRQSKTAGTPGAWLPASLPPATSLILPGLPASPGSRELYIAVPGSANAQVKVTAVTAKGSYHPTGGNGIDLPGGSAVAVALPSLGGIAAAIKLTSNVPVTAAIKMPGGPAGAPGVFTAASAPVQEQEDPDHAAGNRRGTGRCRRPARPGGHRQGEAHGHRAAPRANRIRRAAAVRRGDHPAGGIGAGLRRAGALGGRHGGVDLPRADRADLGAAAPRAPIPRRRAALVLALVLVLGRVAGIDRAGIDAEQPGELLDHDVKHELTQVLLAVRAGEQRPPVQHDARRRCRAAGVARAARTRLQPGQRHRIGQVGGPPGRRYLLDGELDPGQLGCPPRLKLGDGLEHQVIEALRAAPVDGGVLRGEHAAQAPAMPVPPPDPAGDRRAAVASLHNDRAYPGGRCRTARGDTIVQSAPGGGVTACGSIRSAVVSDLRDSVCRAARERAADKVPRPRTVP